MSVNDDRATVLYARNTDEEVRLHCNQKIREWLYEFTLSLFSAVVIWVLKFFLKWYIEFYVYFSMLGLVLLYDQWLIK